MKKILYEVSIIRPLVILLLVVMHSFTMYNGGWPLPEGITSVTAYAWLVKFISGFRIETIALIAGYVFAFQSLELNRKYQLRDFALKKFKRLIIPGLIFSLCYYFCFLSNEWQFGSLTFFIQLSSGLGHMWFLPMLFWCFIVLWLVDHYKIYSKLLFFCLAIISLFSIPRLPFGISRVFHFSFYCVLGYHLYRYKDKILKYKNLKYYCLILYCLLVIISGYNSMSGVITQIIKLALACTGIFAVYLFVCQYITRNDTYKPKEWIIKASGICYGVYILHQFILKYLYYYTELPLILGKYILPWVGMLIALSLSLVGSVLMLKTKVGRFLIG